MRPGPQPRRLPCPSPLRPITRHSFCVCSAAIFGWKSRFPRSLYAHRFPLGDALAVCIRPVQRARRAPTRHGCGHRQGLRQHPGRCGQGTWLTYAELAEVRGIDRHSAVKLVTRHRWRRQKDNRGVLRILVPSEWAAPKDKGTNRGTDQGTDMGSDMSRVVNALEASVSSLTERALAAEKRADRAEIRAEQAEIRTDRAERAVADERNRAMS